MTLAIGLDVGGSTIRAAAFTDDNPKPVLQHRELIGEPRDPASLVARIAEIVERLAIDPSKVCVGVGIAALLRDRIGTVANSPHLRWRDVPFGTLLAGRLGPRFRLGVYNDVNAITWGEATAGAARGCRDVLVVYVGTGIGGGVIANGRLVEGATNCAGEIGHTKVRWDDAAAPCACGQRGCVEAYVGGSYLDRRIAREVPAKSLAVTLAGGRDRVTAAHVDQAAAEGDTWALALWTEVAPLLAVAIGNALAVLNSERLVLGGGLLSRTPALVELVELGLALATPNAIMEPLTVVPAALGDDAGLIGAARLASRKPETSEGVTVG